MKLVWERPIDGIVDAEKYQQDKRVFYKKLYQRQIQKKLVKFEAEIKAEVNAEFEAKARIEAEIEKRKHKSELAETKENRISQFCRCKFLY